MIKEAAIIELLLIRQQEKKANQLARQFKAKREELESELIAALNSKQRVEPCDYKLFVETFEKTYSPSYKTCAIELSSETQVLEWVTSTHPHEESERLVVEVKPKRKAA